MAGRERGHPGPVAEAGLAGRNRPHRGNRLPALVPLPGRNPLHSADPHPLLDRHLEAPPDEQEDGAGDRTTQIEERGKISYDAIGTFLFLSITQHLPLSPPLFNSLQCQHHYFFLPKRKDVEHFYFRIA